MLSQSLLELIEKEASAFVGGLLEQECQHFIKMHSDLKTEKGYAMVVRCGYHSERTLHTRIGKIMVKAPKVRTRHKNKVHFNSYFIRPYRRSVEHQSYLHNNVNRFICSVKNSDELGAIESVFGIKVVELGELSAMLSDFKYFDPILKPIKMSIHKQPFVMIWCEGISPDPNVDPAGTLVICGLLLSGKPQIIEICDGNPASIKDWTYSLSRLKHLGINFPLAVHTARSKVVSNALAKVFPEVIVSEV